MNLIKQLDQNTINQIAAGEVIEDPSSVVKELVENSIDSDSNHIIIKIEDGGKRSIEVIDNGKGMSVDDMKVCYHKHTTSKISSVHDITNVKTMGFRGEGLASISSVSKLSIKSKREIDEYGYEIYIENSEVLKENICAFPNKGTRILVQDLFYNIPARKAFLEKEKITRVTKQTMDLIHRLSLSQPHIRFELYIGGEKMYQTTGSNNIQHIISQIYNKELAKKLIYVDTEVYGVKVKGYISKPEDCVGNRTKQTFFVNNRFVQMDILSQAMRNAYNTFAVSKKHPVCILFLELDENQLDINVHPRKIEVRFKHNVFPVITSSVQGTLHQNKSVLNASGNYQPSGYSNTVSENNINTNRYNSFKDDSSQTQNEILKPFSLPTSDIEEDLFDTLEDTQDEENVDSNDFEITYENEQLTLMEDENEPHIYKDYKNLQILGQIMESYIVASHNDGMIMIDQHAAHERILYEKYMDKFYHESIETVEPLLSLTIELDSSDYLSVKQNFDFFVKYGFILEDFGSNTILVREHPTFIKDYQIKNIVSTMIDEFLSLKDETVIEKNKHDKIIMKSCKDAIKANMKLNHMQMDKLIQDLSLCDNPYHCPHGRPVIINYDKYAIEKSFNRVV